MKMFVERGRGKICIVLSGKAKGGQDAGILPMQYRDPHSREIPASGPEFGFLRHSGEAA
jgi:hypothetical protein